MVQNDTDFYTEIYTFFGLFQVKVFRNRPRYLIIYGSGYIFYVFFEIYLIRT